MEDDMENSKMLMDKIKNIYKEHTKIPKKELDNILKHDIWWEAEKCLEYGLIDELI
jgi:ATP-dependent protease ClpP protease subunit